VLPMTNDARLVQCLRRILASPASIGRHTKQHALPDRADFKIGNRARMWVSPVIHVQRAVVPSDIDLSRLPHD